MSTLPHVTIYTDGACKGNPGPGGWGALLVAGNPQSGGKEKELSGGLKETTNNQMELMAAVEALNALKQPCAVDLWTDSSYVKDGITKWIHGWRAKGWKTAAGKPVKNKELWLALWEAVQRHEMQWYWVKGHDGHPENERVDELACAAAEKMR